MWGALDQSSKIFKASHAILMSLDLRGMTLKRQKRRHGNSPHESANAPATSPTQLKSATKRQPLPDVAADKSDADYTLRTPFGTAGRTLADPLKRRYAGLKTYILPRHFLLAMRINLNAITWAKSSRNTSRSITTGDKSAASTNANPSFHHTSSWPVSTEPAAPAIAHSAPHHQQMLAAACRKKTVKHHANR